MKTGAPTFKPSRFAATKWPVSCTNIKRTKPTANHKPHNKKYAPIDRIIVPPVFKITGKNFSAGRIMNFSLAKNLTISTPTTPSGPSSFFSFWPADEASGGPCQTGGGAGGACGGACGGGGGGGT